MFKKIIQFVVYSSKDPSQISLTLKGFAGVVASIIVTIGAVFGLQQLPASELTQALKDAVDGTMTIVAGVSALVSVYGAIRKIYLTAKGENKAI
jgi:hypothetical protein